MVKTNTVRLTNLNQDDTEMEMGVLFLDIWAVDKFFDYNTKSPTIVPQLEAGDEVWLKSATAGYSHVLLYIGNGEVVHVSDVMKSGMRLGKTIICRDKLDDVGRNKLIGCRKTPKLDDRKRQEIIDRALKDIGKYFPYLLTTDNCEHQVKYWISGVKDYRWIISTQVRDYIIIGIIAALVGVAVGVGVVIGTWSTGVFAILIGAVGGGLITAIIVLGIKYIVTSCENRDVLRPVDV